jgi:DNA-binding transcriptional LysR family regulator
MDTRDWLIIKTLYEEKNITKAAEKLYISQPALTNRLQHIEKEFGISIAIRYRRGIIFTPQGEYLAQAAYEFIQKTEKTRENLLNMEDTVSGTLRIAVSKFFMKYKLPMIISQFKMLYPNVEFKITTDWSANVFNLVYNQGVHIAIVRGDYEWLGCKDLLFEENICIASTDTISIKKLPEYPRIEYKTDIMLKSIYDSWWHENYKKPPNTIMEVDQVDTCKEMVSHGIGYAIMPNLILKKLENVQTININDKKGNPLFRRTWMLYDEEMLNIHVVRAFVDFMKSYAF